MTSPVNPISRARPGAPGEIESILEYLAEIQILIRVIQQISESSQMTGELLSALASHVERGVTVVQQLNFGLSLLLLNEPMDYPNPLESSATTGNSRFQRVGDYCAEGESKAENRPWDRGVD